MTLKQVELLCFYCWQLQIITVKDLMEFKQRHNIQTNNELLTQLSIIFNLGGCLK